MAATQKTNSSVCLCIPWGEFSSALERGDFQLGGLFRRDLFNNPMCYLNFFKKSAYNFHGWENKKYEELLELIYQEKDREENLKKIEQLLIEEAPAIALVNQTYLILKNKRIKDVNWNENGCLDLNGAWIDENLDSHSDSFTTGLYDCLPNEEK